MHFRAICDFQQCDCWHQPSPSYACVQSVFLWGFCQSLRCRGLGCRPSSWSYKPLPVCSLDHHDKTDQSGFTNGTLNFRLTKTTHLTLMMTSAQVKENSVTTTDNSLSHDFNEAMYCSTKTLLFYLYLPKRRSYS